ncbi:MAG: NADH-quinone oxidoreductase subunit J [Chloroflexi bacterium]|nr:NADH-quinone oxidoreductase subunit J [Chloroflexota bacterium]MCH8817346.1 NADH-quinone oxidoreductase subunit J [Chloroflexota bacterium]
MGIVDVIFWLISAAAIGGALLVVTVRDVFRAALALAGSFLAVAGIFFLLQAEFVAVAQILVYVGAVSIVVAFAILLTRDISQGNRTQGSRVIVVGAAIMAVLFVVVVGVVAYDTDWSDRDSGLTNPDAIAALTGTYEAFERPSGEVVLVASTDPDAALPGVFVDSTGWLGGLIVRDYVLALQALGVLLLASIIGAIALVREQAPE